LTQPLEPAHFWQTRHTRMAQNDIYSCLDRLV